MLLSSETLRSSTTNRCILDMCRKVNKCRCRLYGVSPGPNGTFEARIAQDVAVAVPVKAKHKKRPPAADRREARESTKRKRAQDSADTEQQDQAGASTPRDPPDTVPKEDQSSAKNGHASKRRRARNTADTDEGMTTSDDQQDE